MLENLIWQKENIYSHANWTSSRHAKNEIHCTMTINHFKIMQLYFFNSIMLELLKFNP